MEELIEYIDRCPKPKVAQKVYKENEFFNQLGAFHTDGTKVALWQEIYSLKNVANCLTKVKTVGFNQKLSVFGNLQVSCASAGYCVGSCNWMIQSDMEKIGYMASSSTFTTHPKPIEHQFLRGVDVLLMTSLNQTPLANPNTLLGELCQAVENTLKNGGNVLIPCHSAGDVYDLFECLSGHLESEGILNTMYFVSPVAHKSLAYSGILVCRSPIPTHLDQSSILSNRHPPHVLSSQQALAGDATQRSGFAQCLQRGSRNLFEQI